MNRRLLLLVFCLLVAPLLHAGETAVDSVRIYYRHGYRYVDTSLRSNGSVLKNLCAKIEKSLQEETLEKVVIYAYTSPDGTNKANTALAARRADSLESWILRNTVLPGKLLEKNSGGIAWDLLREAVFKSEMQYKEEVLRILDNTPVWVFDGNSRVVSSRKKELMDLKGGVPYRYMYEHLFPDLRSSIAILLYIRVQEPQAEEEVEPAAPEESEPVAPEEDMTPVAPQENVKPVAPEEKATPAEVASEQEKKDFRPFLAIKTNLLYWATIMPDFHSYTFVPNLELEWFFCNRWSLSGTGNFAKWSYGDDFFGISSWSIEPRFWLNGNGRFRGFYLGVYGQAGDYDSQNGRADLDGNTGNLWGTGLSFGAAIPFSDRVGLEVGIRGGYRHSEVNGYTYEAPDYFLDYETSDNHWGVTGIKASLYFRFGRKF